MWYDSHNVFIFIFSCLASFLGFIFSSYCGHIFLYSLYFHISMSSNIGFHIFLILWPHIAHSSGNMLLKVLQCCRFSIIMNLNGNLLPENCIADSSFPLSMDVNVVNCQLVYFWQECGKKDDGENLCRPYFHSVCQGTYHLHLSKKLFTMIIST